METIALVDPHTHESQGHAPDVPSGDAAAVLRAFREVAEALAEDRGLDDLLRLILVKICDLVGVPRGTVYMREQNQNRFRGRVGHDASNVTDARVRRLQIGMTADAFTHEIVTTKAPVIVQHAATDPRLFQSTVRDWKVRSMMGVPMLIRGEVIGIITLDPEDRPHRFTAAHCETAAGFANLSAVAVAQAQASAELRETMRTVDRQNRVLRRVSAVEDRLTALALEGRDLTEVATTVAELTGKPCSIYDGDHHQLAAAGAPGDPDGVRPRLLDPDVRSHPKIAEALTALEARKVAVVGPIPSIGVHHRYLAAPVLSQGELWGTLVVMEHVSRFGQFDSMVARRAATIVALQVMAERRAIAAQWDAGAALLNELLRGHRDLAMLRRRAEFLGLNLDHPRVLALFSCRTDAAELLPSTTAIADVFEEIAPGMLSLVASVAEGVAVVLELPEGASDVGVAREKVREACDRLAAEDGLLVGISRICRAPDAYVQAYEHVGEVARCLDDFTVPGRSSVVAVDDLGAGRLFLVGSGREVADRFAEETLGPLLLEETPLLLTTLTAFFEEDRSIRRTAERLDVHENTIRYRLTRIEELTGLPVRNDSSAQLSAQLALLVLRLRGRIADDED